MCYNKSLKGDIFMYKLNYETTLFINNEKTVINKTSDVISDNGSEKTTLNLYPDMKGQSFEGFGGAFTDSSGYIYSLQPHAR
jgi:glucosylceramidase